LGFTPNYLWIGPDQQLFASVLGWSSIIRQGFESSVPDLQKAQREVENAREAELAQKLTHKPSGNLVIRNANVFDSLKGTTLAKQRVTVRGDRIASIEAEPDAEAGQPPAAGAEVIDGTGKTLMPGLWDMHAHEFPLSAYLNMAAGVTTVRDLGNSI